MNGREPHPKALHNFENALLSESKVRYPLRDPDKCKPFGALGYSEESGNWEELRDRIREGLPHSLALLLSRTQWGDNYRVDMMLDGPSGEKAQEIKAPTDLEEVGVRAGDRGVVIEVFEHPEAAVMVEYADEEGQTKAQVIYSPDLTQLLEVIPEHT